MNLVFKNILVVQDAYRDSVKAMEWANKIVPNDGKIMILDVQPPLSEFWQRMLADEYEETPVHHRQKSLRELALSVDFKVRATARVRSGTPVVQIVREALTDRFDVVVKEAYAKASDLVFGNLDMRLLRYCPIPVWLAHPEARHRCSKVLVALNPDADAKEMKLNKRILGYAARVAGRFKCKLFVVAAFQGPTNMFPIADKDSLKRIELQMGSVARQSREVIQKLLSESQVAIDQEQLIVAEGWPDEVIVNAAESVEPDLLVMGSVARHGISGLLIGNAAERVLREVDCSVLAIKPENFVTPIDPDLPEGLPNAGLAY